MLRHSLQDSLAESGQHLVLYDDDCGLCNGFVQRLLEYDHREFFNFASIQSQAAANQLARFVVHSCPANSFFVIANYEGSESVFLDKSGAALFILKKLGWPWKALGIASWLPVSFLDRIYDVVAKNRNRVFGRRDYCFASAPKYKRRFLESAVYNVPKAEVRQ
jgi:predicted DCC family thiol-disulfide oxidoreductase YuxK